MDVTITKSKQKDKKFDAIIADKKDNKTETVSLGAKGYSDYTKHKNEERKRRCIARHSNEDHTKSKIKSPAFMSRLILWNKPSLAQSARDLNSKIEGVRFKIARDFEAYIYDMFQEII